ncbi:MAG: transglutaminase domain-containing protein [Clostridiales bacterium]|nr:transglutaminase domain-containing protein [Clostridiales bacterium]
MKTNEKLMRLLWFTGLGGLYIASLLFMVRSATLMEGSSLLIILLSLGAALLAGLVFYSVRTFLCSLGAGAVLLFIRYLTLLKGRDWSAPLRSLGSRLADIWSQILGAPFRPEDSLLLLCLLAALFSLLAVCFFYKKARFWPAALPPLICYLLGSMGRYEVNVPASLTAFFCLIVLFLASRRPAALASSPTVELQTGKKKNGLWSGGGLPVTALLAAAVSMSLAALLPFSSSPTPGIRTYVPQYADLGEFLDNFHIEGQWFSLTGFSDGNTPLGGDLYLDDSRVMDVRADGRVYLAGAAYRTYNGRAWLDGEAVTQLCDPTDLEEGRPEALFQEGVYKKNRVTVTMRQTGDNLFYPERAWSVRLPGGSTLFTNRQGGYYVQPAMTPGDSYTAVARVLDPSAPAAASALNDAGFGYYARWENVDMAAYAEEIRRSYTALTETLPYRVVSLARDITDGQLREYDKAKAIEQYLCAHYTYSLQPGALPAGQDFVDYFLFESRQGYCTHYATAMTMLCRAVGLPARFVKGFVTPAQPGPSGAYQVTGRTSHAWSEVYLEGLGWIRFEPTAPFNTDWGSQLQTLAPEVAEDRDYLGEIGFYEGEDGQAMSSRPDHTVSAPSSSSQPSSEPSSLPASSDGLSSDYAGSLPDGLTPSDIPAELPSNQPPDGLLPGDQAGRAGDSSPLWLGFLLTGLTAAVLLGAVLVQAGRARRRIRLRQEASGKRRIQLTFRELLRLLEYLGAEARMGETASDMAQRLEAQEALSGLGLPEAAQLYETVLFGGEEPAEADCRLMDAIYEALFGCVRQKLSAPAFIWQRYIRNRV